MSKDGGLPVIQSGAAGNGGVTRREMVRRLVAAMGAGAAWPLVAASHPIYEHFANDVLLMEAEKLGAADWKPVFLNRQQDETLIALAESIVPGSTKAQVDRFIDLLLNVDSTEHQHKFAEALAAFETESQKRFGKRFPSLDAREQNVLLTEASGSAAENSPSGRGGERNAALREHFENLKGWISGAYYSSEAGMRELGWTGDYAYESFPGCPHPEGHN